MKFAVLRVSLMTACISIGAACGHARSPAELESGLESPDASVRRDSADDLRDGGRVPDDALPKLYAAIDKEHDAEAYGAMLLTLGASGDAGALPYLCGTTGGQAIDDARVSRWQSHALTAWQRKNPDGGGCSMSAIQEVPKSQGPQQTKTKPVAPRATLMSPGM